VAHGCNEQWVRIRLLSALGENASRADGSIRSRRHDNSNEGGVFVNKAEMIEHIAEQADISKAAATRALEAMIGGVLTTLKKNESVAIVGFGTFAVTKRLARVGRNPRTGAEIKIKAARVPKFRPGKGLKDALN
jgi:DNA-binding protein HU-beta